MPQTGIEPFQGGENTIKQEVFAHLPMSVSKNVIKEICPVRKWTSHRGNSMFLSKSASYFCLLYTY